MNTKTCKDCLNCSVDDGDVLCSGMLWHYPFGGSDVVSLDKEACEHFLERKKPTVFDQITASPEVLAEKLVYEIRSTDPVFGGTYYWWCSTIIPGEKWKKREEVFSATVEKLKEVTK